MKRFPTMRTMLVAGLFALLGIGSSILVAQTAVSTRVGPIFQADGTTPQLRASKTGDLIVQAGRGAYAEATLRGNCYVAMTATTGVSVASLAQGTTGPFTLANPAGSGKRLVVHRATMGYVSGTMPAGNITYSVNTNASAAAVTGTALTPVNLDIGQGNNAVAKPFTTSTLPAAPTPIRNLCTSLPFLATTATYAFNTVDDVAGAIVIEPGCSLTFSGTTTAGSTPLVVFSVEWEEVPQG